MKEGRQVGRRVEGKNSSMDRRVSRQVNKLWALYLPKGVLLT